MNRKKIAWYYSIITYATMFRESMKMEKIRVALTKNLRFTIQQKNR